jgi:hypothetical protein
MTTGQRRAILAAVLGIGLIAAVIIILAFVDATAMIEDSTRCAPTIWQSQWPRYLGCTLAAHEGLAGGLIGVAGAIWAAWLAYTAVQEQIAGEKTAREQQRHDEEERLRRLQISAQKAASTCIKPAIRAAGLAVLELETWLVGDTENSDVRRAARHVEDALSSFTIREAVHDLRPEDKNTYLEIVGLLSSFVSVEKNKTSEPSQDTYAAETEGLLLLRPLLKKFDPKLLEEFERAKFDPELLERLRQRQINATSSPA